MKIVNRETFLKQPIGTLFSKYKPIIIKDLCIKGESQFFDGGNDFYYQPIVDSIDCHSSEDFHDQFEHSYKYGSDMNMNFNYETRDGLFEEDQLFAIWSNKDVEDLIIRLKEALRQTS